MEIQKVIEKLSATVAKTTDASKGLESRMKKELGKHPLIGFSYTQSDGTGYFALRGPKKTVEKRVAKMFKVMDLKQKRTWTNKAAPDLHFFSFKT
jgi:hypothetical protein